MGMLWIVFELSTIPEFHLFSIIFSCNYLVWVLFIYFNHTPIPVILLEAFCFWILWQRFSYETYTFSTKIVNNFFYLTYSSFKFELLVSFSLVCFIFWYLDSISVCQFLRVIFPWKLKSILNYIVFNFIRFSLLTLFQFSLFN